ncbi:MAG: nucleoside deaminase [Pseudomonadota bacterium]|nr:MAG: nucleoside deaminase [Pseudomonadota bacterium]
MPINGFRVDLPDWMGAFERRLPECLPEAEARMAAAISLSDQNARHDTGGPFGALVVRIEDGQVIALGVNRVEPQQCSSAHAEIVAMSMAQRRLGHWNLAAASIGPLQLVTSCEPCAMCLGAIPWSGVKSVLCGALTADAEAAGFDEGVRPSDWIEVLARRGIDVRTAVLREPAARVLERYARTGGSIYNP